MVETLVAKEAGFSCATTLKSLFAQLSSDEGVASRMLAPLAIIIGVELSFKVKVDTRDSFSERSASTSEGSDELRSRHCRTAKGEDQALKRWDAKTGGRNNWIQF